MGIEKNRRKECPKFLMWANEITTFLRVKKCVNVFIIQQHLQSFYNLNSVNYGVRVEAEERVDPRASNIVDGEGRKLTFKIYRL